MNRLIAAASIDTVNRLAKHVVQTHLSEGIKSNLESNKLADVSIDNIDILATAIRICILPGCYK